MKAKISVPSKTFLLGEYMVLENGPCWILNTEPRFELLIQSSGEGSFRNIHPSSPGGKWARKTKEIFQNFDLEFIDPHQGLGGFGASSAQFALTYVWSTLCRSHLEVLAHKGLDVRSLWQDYLSVHQDINPPPSGADVVGQVLGQLVNIHFQDFKVTSQSWNMDNLSFLLFATGQKVKTHEHLQKITNGDTQNYLPKDSYKYLLEMLDVANQGLRENNSLALVHAVNEYHGTLNKLNLVAQRTVDGVADLRRSPHVLAAKGCGAMGADVILVLCRQESKPDIIEHGESLGLRWVADENMLSPGVQLSVSFDTDTQPEIKNSKSLPLEI